MKEALELQDMQNILEGVTKLLVDNADHLCELDSVVGDGDHGTTISRGVRAGWEKVQENSSDTIFDLINTFAMEMIERMGGASGPIFGSLFRGMAVASKNQNNINGEILTNMFSKGLDKVKSLGKAEPGDKTLVDSLEPAVNSMKQAQADGKNLSEIIQAGYDAALTGVENTKEMTAAKGRSRYAGDRGLGHKDAGSVSGSLIIQAFAKYINE